VPLRIRFLTKIKAKTILPKLKLSRNNDDLKNLGLKNLGLIKVGNKLVTLEGLLKMQAPRVKGDLNLNEVTITSLPQGENQR